MTEKYTRRITNTNFFGGWHLQINRHIRVLQFLFDMFRIRTFVIFGACLACTAAFAGDYQLTIANDPGAACAEPANRVRAFCEEQRRSGTACRADESYPISDAGHVVADLSKYFLGGKPEISLIPVAFANGHVTFCGALERRAVEREFVRLASLDNITHERELTDILAIYRSSEMFDEIQRQLSANSAPSHVQKRLARLSRQLSAATRK